jgi:polyisoprenoid-binding protein YceI
MVELPGAPKSKRRTMLAIGAGLFLLACAVFALVYFVLFPTSSPKRFSLSPSTAATPVASGTTLAGSWRIANGSQAGYRVREKLAFLPAESDAVGRTSSITGAATVTQSQRVVSITAASFDVAVDTLKSDRAMRDEKIREIGLESNAYPTATFVLSKPLVLPASALDGRIAHMSATGVFNIHGVSKSETVPLEMSLSSSTIQAVGSLTFPWSEFGMSAPSIGGFVNVTDRATMEFELRLRRS